MQIGFRSSKVNSSISNEDGSPIIKLARPKLSKVSSEQSGFEKTWKLVHKDSFKSSKLFKYEIPINSLQFFCWYYIWINCINQIALGTKNSSKNILKFQESNASKFLQGGNTLPLISELFAGGIRNNNMDDVHERLKFLTKEWFHNNESNEEVFRSILYELEWYIKSYEEEWEDSDWDSDEECSAVSIIKDLKKVIDLKANLVHEINEVELRLIAANSGVNRERSKSIFMNTSDSFSIKMNKTNNTEESSKIKDSNESTIDNKDDSLYKNVLKKGTILSSDKSNTEKHSSLDIDSFTSDSSNKQLILNVSPPHPGKKDGNKYESRVKRRLSTNELSKNKRSSSNQSLKSSKSVLNLK